MRLAFKAAAIALGFVTLGEMILADDWQHVRSESVGIGAICGPCFFLRFKQVGTIA
jgi:hypothetical protein